ncbi:MAPEG family protein [Roseovarius phycicola]|uniref:MAPEG family protein n=1 Tax=Roseovarius phycicola TaxID=3080976 RepID=A0ABZ2HPX3_9RHOB
MSQKRGMILAGMATGALWAIGLLWIGAQIPVPIAMIQPVLMGAVFGPGVVLMLMIARLAQRRFGDDTAIDGQKLTGGAAVDQAVLTNTLEQVVLALCIWPLVGFFLGAGTVLVLGLGFVVARLLFWGGYHLSPPLRAFGFAATFYPTLFAAVWVILRLVSG